MQTVRRILRGRPHGFVFIELVMVTGIVAVVAVLILESLTHGVDFWETSNAQAELHSQLEHGLNQIARELQRATRTTGGAAPEVQVPPAPGNTTMTFYLPTAAVIDGLGNTDWDTLNPITYQFNAANRQIRRVVGGAQQIMVNDVVNATFDDQGTNPALYANEIQVALTLQRTTPHNRPVSASATTIVKLRN